MTNHQIQAQNVLLIDETGASCGVVSITSAMSKAQAAGLDLVEIAPHATPPTCKILDYGKMNFGKQKKQKQKKRSLREVRFTPSIDVGDYTVKLKNIKRFLEGGDKVKVTMRFKGREMMHFQRGEEVIKRIVEDLGELAAVDQEAKSEGRQIIMILSGKTNKK